MLRSVLFFPAMQPQRPVFTVYKKRDTGCTIKTQRQHAHIRRGSNRAFDSPVMLNTTAEKHNFFIYSEGRAGEMQSIETEMILHPPADIKIKRFTILILNIISVL